jgi:putative ABC transport system substrate-binding protein
VNSIAIKGDPTWQAFVKGLQEHGYVQGQNLLIECRWTEGREDRAVALAAELVSLKPDLLVTNSGVNTRAAKQVTSTLPIVMVSVTDPVGRGVVASLAHPGGNVTGLTDTPIEIEGKRLQLLKEAAPHISRVAVLTYSGGPLPPGPDVFGREQAAAARELGVTLQFYRVRAPEEFAGAFAAMTKERAEALLLVAYPIFRGREKQIAEFAAQSRLPAMAPFREFVEAGGLLSYDMNRPERFRRAGFFVDKILNGAKPGDLPVEQPTKFELVINLKTAKALGLTVPPSLLIRADEVIE